MHRKWNYFWKTIYNTQKNYVIKIIYIQSCTFRHFTKKLYLEEYVWKDILPHFFAENLSQTLLYAIHTLSRGEEVKVCFYPVCPLTPIIEIFDRGKNNPMVNFGIFFFQWLKKRANFFFDFFFHFCPRPQKRILR